MRVPTSRGPHPLTNDKKTSETYNVDPDVRQVREQYGLSQDKFAKLMGIGLVTFQNWEEGRRQPELLARILLRVATRVHPRVLVATWLAVGLMVGVADRVHHQNSLFPIFFHLLGFVFGFVGCLVFVTGILLLRKRVASQATLGFYCGLCVAGVFIGGLNLVFGRGSNQVPLDEFEIVLLLIAGIGAGVVSTTLARRTSTLKV